MTPKVSQSAQGPGKKQFKFHGKLLHCKSRTSPGSGFLASSASTPAIATIPTIVALLCRRRVVGRAGARAPQWAKLRVHVPGHSTAATREPSRVSPFKVPILKASIIGKHQIPSIESPGLPQTTRQQRPGSPAAAPS